MEVPAALCAPSDLLDACPDLLCRLDADGTVLFANAAWQTVLGHRPRQVVGRTLDDYLAPDDPPRGLRPGLMSPLVRRLDGRTCRMLHADGSQRPVLWAAQRDGRFTTASGRDLARHGSRGAHVAEEENITLRRRAAEGLRVRSRLLRGVDTPVVVMAPDSTILEWNPAAEALYGWSVDEVRGRRWIAFQDPECECVLASLVTDGHVHGERELRCRDGTSVVVDLHGMRVDDDDGAPVALVALGFDLTARVAAERALRAARDFLRAVTGEMGEGLFTLDHEGHVTFVNRAATQILGREESELLGRVMHDVAHARHPEGDLHAWQDCPLVQAAADRIPVRVDEDVFVRRSGAFVDVEYAASPFTTEDDVPGLVVVFSDISARKARERELLGLVERAETVSAVRQALHDERLVLHAQPIISVATRATVQHELLLRMQTAEGGIVLPAAFLPAVELVGLMRDVDRWVIEQSVELAAAGSRVQVNLSATSLSDPELFDEITSEIRARGADPALMVFELTETGVLRDQSSARRFVQRIEGFGARVALDDFGTGYSSLSYLKQLPVSYLKIDIGFVRDLATSEASRHVVRAMVELARNFELQTIGEGVEDEAVLEVLSDIGVDYAQGYAIGAPVPLQDAFGADS